MQSLLGAALLAPFAFAGGLPALTPALLLGALALGPISAVCHFLTVAAYQRADATLLAPFLYFNLLTAMAVGFLFFGETLGLGEHRGPAGDRRRRPGDADEARGAGSAGADRLAGALSRDRRGFPCLT